ncbi:expressed unknown protein [Seminavis robusta]|uniref:Uncharacterized protein n=1 Tax=Seminavis robusta TaxID=568900 RepID=A0A9N8DYZ0_9STRA|nr:expressed unknown protein [Seminavis robusta]|eukprot:Sro484_g152300.1 n/a (145) ;mRNA; f:55675-56207
MMNKAATLLSTVLLLGSAQANLLPGGPTDPEPTDPCEPKCCLQPRRKELEAGELFVKEAHERALEEEDAPLMCGDEPAGYSCFSEYEFCEGSCGVDYADYCGNFGGLVCYPNCPTDPPPTDPEPTDGGCCGDPHFKVSQELSSL